MHKKILVVDADELILYGLARALPSEGVEVTTAGTASQAILHLSACPYDLCLLDVHLPDFSGMMLMKIIRDICPKVRIIIMTAGYIDEPYLGDSIREAIGDGACHFIAKPFDLYQLKEIVVEALHAEDGFHTGFRFIGDRFSERKKRKNDRRLCFDEIRYSVCIVENGESSRKQLLARTVDVSENGVGFLTDYPLRPSQVVIFEDDDLRRTGLVAWSIMVDERTCRAGARYA